MSPLQEGIPMYDKIYNEISQRHSVQWPPIGDGTLSETIANRHAFW